MPVITEVNVKPPIERKRFVGKFMIREVDLTISTANSIAGSAGSSGTASGFHGFKIAVLADFHFGLITSLKHINAAIEITNSLAPDLIFLMGDYIQLDRVAHRHTYASKVHPNVSMLLSYKREVRILAKEMADALSKLRAPSGIIGIFGNHDYREGIPMITRHFPKSIRWLLNKTELIKRGNRVLEIGGVDDHRRGTPDLKALGKRNSQTCFRILLSHNPDVVLREDAALISEFDLMLCGHTHGGQICLPLIGPIVTRTVQREHVRGLSYFRGSSSIEAFRAAVPVIVSHGVGYGLVPLRVLCPPEITLVTLNDS